MTFPTITHINDVLPSVANRQDFVIADKGDYTVIDYVYTLDDSFDDPIRRECRGIKFAKDGTLLARPFGKFFNIGERPDTQPHLLDFTKPHTIMEKLDGSMIHPAIVNGEVVFMTRMGRTEHAIRAERHLTRRLAHGLDTMCRNAVTPVFEWTAPDNRIVVRYEESALTLLAVRDNLTGKYVDAAPYARLLQVPSVPVLSSQYATTNDFLAYARAITGKEGFVVRWEDGTMVKAKGEDYVLKHRAKDSILQEKNLLALVLSGGLDDVLPLLDEADADACREYARQVEEGVHKTAQELAAFVAANDNLPQKEFATGPVQTLPATLRPLAFKTRLGNSALALVRERIAANCNSQTNVDECRDLHGARWEIA